jgi:hypothetical protein
MCFGNVNFNRYSVFLIFFSFFMFHFHVFNHECVCIFHRCPGTLFEILVTRISILKKAC